MRPRPTRAFVPYEPVTLRATKYTHILHSELLGMEKVCRICGESWPLDGDFFQVKRDNPDGFANRCKDCAAKQKADQKQRAAERRQQEASGQLSA